MRNQSYNSVVAPRAGFEPATNRLTPDAAETASGAML